MDQTASAEVLEGPGFQGEVRAPRKNKLGGQSFKGRPAQHGGVSKLEVIGAKWIQREQVCKCAPV